VLSSQLVMKDIHSVSSLLKMYFRELPDPVCTFPLYDQFVAAVQSTDPGEEAERAGLLRAVLSLLPASNHRTLGCLLRPLHRVALHSDSTGMTAKNLAIVWAPNLLRYLASFHPRPFTPIAFPGVAPWRMEARACWPGSGSRPPSRRASSSSAPPSSPRARSPRMAATRGTTSQGRRST
jgi:hypothetical protein